MVHAEASTFAKDITKEDAYSQVLKQAKGLFEEQRNWVCNLANAAALLWHAYASLPRPLSSVNWTGFYVVDSAVCEQLVLGPFMGKVACQTIAFSRGVCGASASRKETLVVDDVDTFPGHVRCDAETESEIVVPVLGKDGKLVAVIDIDCMEKSAFDDVDRMWLERLAHLLGESCDWEFLVQKKVDD